MAITISGNGITSSEILDGTITDSDVNTDKIVVKDGSGGVSVDNTENKTYPTTQSFQSDLGFRQNIEVGGTQTVNSTTPGGYNFLTGMANRLTKSNGNIQDIDRAYYTGFRQSFYWEDQNTCKQYVSTIDNFIYYGKDANGKTSSSFNAPSIGFLPDGGATQTLSNVNSADILLNSRAVSPDTATVNIGNAKGLTSSIRFRNGSNGTHNYHIDQYKAFATSSYWGVSGGQGTMTAVVDNYYGLYLNPPSNTTDLTITNNYGVYSGWSESANYFAGPVRIGSDTEANQIDDSSSGATSSTLYIGNRVIDTSASDARFKDVIGSCAHGLDTIKKFNVVDFTWKPEFDSDSSTVMSGLLAQEVELIDPSLVVKPAYREEDILAYTPDLDWIPEEEETEDDRPLVGTPTGEKRILQTPDDEGWSVKYNMVVPHLIQAIQELTARIEDSQQELKNWRHPK
jgi:hypothetical protein